MTGDSVIITVHGVSVPSCINLTYIVVQPVLALTMSRSIRKYGGFLKQDSLKPYLCIFCFVRFDNLKAVVDVYVASMMYAFAFLD